jgi:hypothetical protein
MPERLSALSPLRAAVHTLERAAILHGKVAIDREAAITIVSLVIEAYIAALTQLEAQRAEVPSEVQ